MSPRERRDVNIYVSEETARYLALLQERWDTSRSGAIARAVKMAAEALDD